MLQFHISKTDLRDTRMADVAPGALADGAARLRLDLFALTANNITYAAMGSGPLGYWDFFPAPEGFGCPPVWGFATVVQSNAANVEPGARYYGYLPLSETLDVAPVKASARAFVDGAPHRAAKAPVYNQYINVAADPAYDSAFEPEQCLFRPLYATGWWAADCVHQDRPRVVVMSSASSKTALATAHQLRKLGDAQLVALTSARNADYVRATGLYHQTITYDDMSALNADGAATYLDFLGRDETIAAAHRALGANLKRSIQIGATDWADKPDGGFSPRVALEGPKPEFFFVPTYAQGRMSAQPELAAAMVGDLRAFYAASRALVSARHLVGADAIAQSWASLAAGDTPPREGLVLSFKAPE
jgi:hypothetical protein